MMKAFTIMLCVAALALSIGVQASPNLLDNPGFDDGLNYYPIAYAMPAGTLLYANYYGYNLTVSGVGTSYVYHESNFTSSGQGPVNILNGTDSVRFCPGGGPGPNGPVATMNLWQDKAITGGQAYTASIWAYGFSWDAYGHPGFGSSAGDYGRLTCQELDAAGNWLRDAPTAQITTPSNGPGGANGPYSQLSTTWTTGADAAKVRYRFVVSAGCSMFSGHVTADDAYLGLAQVPEPGSLVALATGFAGLFGFAIRRRR